MKHVFFTSQSLLRVLMFSPAASYNLLTSFASKMPDETVSGIKMVTLHVLFSKEAVVVLSLSTVSLQEVSDNTLMP